MEQHVNKVTAGTIARTIILVLALANQALVIAGKPVIEIENEQIEQLVTLAFTIVASVVAWWKNNSFTAAAIEGDKVMHALKDREKAGE